MERKSDESSTLDAPAETPERSRLWAWVERGVWVFVLGLLAQRFGPQLVAAVGVERDLGKVPEFAVTTLAGEGIRSETLEGKVVLINFWATWCGPCRIEMPGFQKVYDDFVDQGFVILGLSTDRAGPGPVRAFLQDRNVSYPVAFSSPEIERAFGGLRGIPMSFLVDRDGVVRARVYGFYAPVALRLAVRKMIQSPRSTRP